MGTFEANHGWGTVDKKAPLYTYLTMMKLGSYTLLKEDPKNI